MTRSRLLLLCLAAALAASTGVSAETPSAPGALQAQQVTPATPAKPPAAPTTSLPFEGVFTIGTYGSNTEGNLNRVGEYEVLSDNALPRLGLQFWGERGNSRYEVFGFNAGSSLDQRYGASVNLARRFKASVSYDRMPHRLDHDPLTWMDAASNIGGTFVVQHTDTAPGDNYEAARGEFVAKAEYAVPFQQGNFRLFAGHRQQMTDGTHQALTTSHCATCHTYSFSRSMDQRLRDLTAGAQVQYQAVTLDYSYENRDFEERAGQVTTTYDRARQPATLADVFLNRVSYDERNGLLPFDSVPGLQKDTHVLRGRLALPKDATVTGAFTRSTTTNVDQGLDTVLTSASGRFVMPFGNKFTLRAAVRRYEIESDEVFVEVGEPIAPAGPSAGLTYAQNFPALGDPDYTRYSSLNRRPTLAEIEGIYRPFKKTTLRLGYEYEDVRRDDFEVERTTTNTLKVNLRSMLKKRFHTQTRLTWDWTKDPFTHVNGAMPEVLQPYQSPGNVPFKPALQYFEMYRSRYANLSSFPTTEGLFEEIATWTPKDRISISGHYRYRTADNDELTLSTWNQSVHMPGVQLWVAPGDRWSVAGGYSYQREESETAFSTLAFVG